MSLSSLLHVRHLRSIYASLHNSSLASNSKDYFSR